MEKKVILFAGKAGSGKNTSADMVMEIVKGAKDFSFAQKLKQIAKDSFLWDGNKDEAGRRLLQQIGATGRAYDKDIWVKQCVAQIVQSGCNLALVTDLRFPNEMEGIKKAFSDVFVVQLYGRAYDLGENSKDVSEHALDDFTGWDYRLDNSGTFDDLRKNVKSMLDKFAI